MKEAERRQTQYFMMPCQRARRRATDESACADPPLRARSPAGVPLRLSRQRPNATAQLQSRGFPGRN